MTTESQLRRTTRTCEHHVTAGGPPAATRLVASLPAFTIVELIVVITVIALLLALAIPGLSKMAQDARVNSAIQTITTTLTRAHVTALADRNLTAVRFVPGEWDYQTTADTDKPTGRQHLLTYEYVCATEDPSNPTQTVYAEHFERLPKSESIQLPSDTWAAPVEALSDSRVVLPDGTVKYPNLGLDGVLTGNLGQFNIDAADRSSAATQLLNADDFLVVFDPQTGVQSFSSTPYRLRAYDVKNSREASEDPPGTSANARPFQRYNFSGVIIYSREPFTALGNGSTGTSQSRQDALRRIGRPYFVHRTSGGLVMGSQPTQ